MTTLLESKARPYGSRKGAVLSLAVHGALIGAAVVGTASVALPAREKIEEHPILYVAPPPPKVYVAPKPLPEVKRPPAAKAPSAPKLVAPPPRQSQPQRPTPAPAQATQPLIAPINVPVSLPPVNLKGLPTVNDVPIPEAKATPIPAGRPKSSADGEVEGGSGKKGGLGSGNSDKAYSESQVDRAVQLTHPSVPRYPDALKSVNVQGEVIVRYIVDARGRVEPGSIQVISATHKLFAEAVRAALLLARYRPAEAGGHPVRQLVEQPFVFKLNQ